MPPKGHMSITVNSSLHKRIGVLKKEHEREIAISDLSLDQFIKTVVTHWERTHRETTGDHRAPQRSKSSNIRGRRDV